MLAEDREKTSEARQTAIHKIAKKSTSNSISRNKGFPFSSAKTGCNLPPALCCRRQRPLLRNLKEAPVPSGRLIPLPVQTSANTGSQNIAVEAQIHSFTAPVHRLSFHSTGNHPISRLTYTC